ncbi:hypothetical protein [Bacillus sp. REN10]|uniref:hypothetical protein n=1 Tax=Bacillus sp. REN10 TaxID=2782541 RepID=UPI00193C24ED|nr:hypothetical protein [Bacillus sp. REN10]
MKESKEGLVKDISWKVDNKTYLIRHVPYTDEEGSEESVYYPLDVALKVAMIRDLMVQEEIQSEVDFRKVADLEFE